MTRRLGMVIAGIPIALFVLMQLVPVWGMQTNPPVVSEPAWDSPQTKELARRACFDCHSNETVWPLYSKIAPVSWLVTYDTLEGRKAMNFSTWGQATGGEAGEAGEAGELGEMAQESAEQIRSGEMPPQIYLTIHADARLTAAEQQQLIDGLQRSLR